ncbi:MAG: histidine phosphatase family protein [Gemmatimonadaceae bacterium]|nr:histidine phosphatase family protein [Gemmatimonadaceae bacterium]
MTVMSRRFVFSMVVASLVMLSGLAPVRVLAQSGPSLVILVRHAEKAAVPGDDPPLSDLGRERAAALAQALKASPPTAIFVSSRQRTGLTADVVAAQTGVAPQVISLDGGGAAHVAAVAAAVRKQQGVVLVVGHSNTTTAIIKALGGPSLPDICDATYSHFFVLTLANGAQPAALTMSHYGAAEPAPPATCVGMIPR